MTAMVMTACTGQQSDTASQNSDKEFNYVVDQFDKSNYYIIFPKRP